MLWQRWIEMTSSVSLGWFLPIPVLAAQKNMANPNELHDVSCINLELLLATHTLHGIHSKGGVPKMRVEC